jgi:uncharacterized protein YozE (UPF0346 family)
MINHVLHHLPDDADSSWPKNKKVFNEFSEYLNPAAD